MSDLRPYPRYLEGRLLRSLSNSPAVLLHGPRQCGKTTLARNALDRKGYKYYDLDDETTLRLAKDDPPGFVLDLPERAIIDEVQNAPEIFRQLKVVIDRNRIPGRYLLTGSSNVLMLAGLTDSLAGRIEFLRLHPLSQSELARRTPDFLGTLFNAGFEYGRYERMGPALCEKVVVGGFPPALVRKTPEDRFDWHRSNLTSVVQSDMARLFRLGHPDMLRGLAEHAAARTASILNVNALSKLFKATQPTVGKYLGLLERMFFLDRLPSWSNNRLQRRIKAPKLHIGDTGLACALLNADADALAADRSMLGPLLETFVYQELRRQASWNDVHMGFHHFRNKNGAEVDIVIEGKGLAVAGIEVKAGASVRPSDFRGLKLLGEAAGKKFLAGVVLYDGETCIRFGDRLFAVPVRRLWEMPSKG